MTETRPMNPGRRRNEPGPPRWPRKRKNTLIMLLALLLAFFIAGAGAGWHALTRPAALPVPIERMFTVDKGAGVGAIAASLVKAGLMDNAYIFRLAVIVKGASAKLKAGEYSIAPGLSALELVDLLVEGRARLFKVALPEGFNMAQVIARLAATIEKPGGGEFKLIDEGLALQYVYDKEFIASLNLDSVNSLEGYLFPDTYFFDSNPGDSKAVLRRLVENFEQVWAKLPPYQGALSLNRHQLVTLASIIEKETGVDAERPLVSAVYHNRLRLGMLLQADPTVVYGTGHQGPITASLLRSNHPYNTYTRPGLPPGPICSPGQASLAAALAPAKVGYLYFVATGRPDGSHNFASNYKDHMQNVNIYRQSQGR